MKHNVGDKFVIEIGETFYSDNDCRKLYSIKGFNALIFDENGLDRLEKLEDKKEPCVDWSKVAVDTPILVSDDGRKWVKRYFAKYMNISNSPIGAYVDGATSWSGEEINYWRYAKLAESEGEHERDTL